jgi:hypothetical protein
MRSRNKLAALTALMLLAAIVISIALVWGDTPAVAGGVATVTKSRADVESQTGPEQVGAVRTAAEPNELDTGHSADEPTLIVVDETDQALPNARLKILDVDFETLDLPKASTSMLAVLRSAKEFATGQLRLGHLNKSMGQRVYWVAVEDSGRESLIVPVQRPWHSVRVVLRQLVSAHCFLDSYAEEYQTLSFFAMPVVPDDTGRPVRNEVLCKRLGLEGWVVLERLRVDATRGRTELGGLVSGYDYEFFCEDLERRLDSESQGGRPPCDIRFLPMERPGVRLVFSGPLPKDGVLIWAPMDRMKAEELLSGSQQVQAGATSAFVPADTRRPWLVDGVGQGWRLKDPIVSDPAVRSVYLAQVQEDPSAVLLRGWAADKVTPMYVKRVNSAPQLAAFSMDPKSGGPRWVRLPGALILRGNPPYLGTIGLHWHDENAVIEAQIGGPGQSVAPPIVVPVRLGRGKPLTDALADTAARPEAEFPWSLEQYVTIGGADLWYSVRRGSSSPARLIDDLEALGRWSAGIYRARIVAGGEWIIPVL